MKLKRIIYFGYYIKKLNRPLFKKFLNYAKEQTGKSKCSLCCDVFKHSLKYNISILEYFQFGFYKPGCTDEYKSSWAGTGYMYEYQGFMNPRKYRDLLEDKRVFNKNYAEFVKHVSVSLEEVQNDNGLVEKLLSNPSGRIVFKNSGGNCGKGIIIEDAGKYTVETLYKFMLDHGYDMVEQCVTQHETVNALSPTAVNTVRVFTQLDENDNVDILGCRLRISVNSCVDNLAAGNLAAPIDTETGIICGPGVYSDITKAETDIHPMTGMKISGTQIPFWNEVIEMVRKAAKLNTVNRTVGWDIAITSEGPDMIEGNREWCKLLLQLPIKKGMRPVLDHYLETQKKYIS